MSSDISKDAADTQLVVTDENSSTFGDVLGTEIIDIFVGPELKHFKVHQRLLCDTVPYFDKMLRGQFKEAVEQTVRLPEDDSDAFGLFLEWIYGGGFRPADMKKHTPTSGPIFNRVKVYCFAEKICLDALMNYTMTSLVSLYNRTKRMPAAQVITFMYQYSKPDSMLRKFGLECFIYILLHDFACWTNEELSSTMSSSQDFRLDYLQLTRSGQALDIKSGIEPRVKPPCSYHVHSKEAACRWKELVPYKELVIVE